MYASPGLGLTLQTVQPPSAASRLRMINPAPLTSSGVSTGLWFALGALVVGGGTYLYLRHRA